MSIKTKFLHVYMYYVITCELTRITYLDGAKKY